ncbi:unnamed protein product [Albugo candida]|uniref:Uncharacterized protein n=2 Tax=Albugo candida TaxID=65357 RepID=A0A024GE08_9STRA|nr:unnamed protein product [Albugo candida]|eukprot:CCI44769.1 unnamed protein product [Albugo candida]
MNGRGMEYDSFAQRAESSPLLRALQTTYETEENHFYDSNELENELDQTLYSIDPSTPNSSEHRDSAFSYKSPVIFAEKALGAILHGALLYALCCIIGIAFISLKFEGLLGNRVNWYIVFLPFWGANVLIIIAHFLSFRHAKKLRQWAEVETMENEPLLPLLRRVMMIYSISVPLTGLLFWCELAFCLQLSNEGKTSFYFCYVPLMLIQLAFVARYMLCFAHSSLPAVCWMLSFVFTLLLGYQTSTATARFHGIPSVRESIEHPQIFPLSWWTVLTPLLALEALMALNLGVILYNEFSGIYRMTKWQLCAAVLYTVGLIMMITGQLLLLLYKIDIRWGTFNFPSACVLLGIFGICIGIYTVGKHHVKVLMATRGGAVPVPLTRTKQGWITNHAMVEHWSLFGEIYLTAYGLRKRQHHKEKRVPSQVDSSRDLFLRWPLLTIFTKMFQRFSKKPDPDESPDMLARQYGGRRTSGIYSNISTEFC